MIMGSLIGALVYTSLPETFSPSLDGDTLLVIAVLNYATRSGNNTEFGHGGSPLPCISGIITLYLTLQEIHSIISLTSRQTNSPPPSPVNLSPFTQRAD